MNILIKNHDFKLDNKDNFFKVEKISIKDNYESDLDIILSQFISKQNEVSSFSIPISLTDNPLDFSGLVLGHHIRLDKNETVKNAPIAYYSPIDFELILKLSNLSNILLTPNVHFFDLKKYSFEQIKESLDKIINENKRLNIKDFLDRVDIRPPSNYESHHSLDNELALFYWSKQIGCQEKNIPEVEDNLKYNLYFKYFLALNPLGDSINKANFLLKGKGNILLIDDEASKGWKNFYHNLLKFNSQNNTIKFESLDIDKNHNKYDILTNSINKVKEFDPDVVLLDLRLCDEDFRSESKPNNLTGFQILKEIKEKINKGIQVIITTASDKVWNYEALVNTGADGYIIKKADNVENRIKNLIATIEEALNKAHFLKKVFIKIQNIKKCIEDNKVFDSEYKNLQNILKPNLDIAYELLTKKLQNPKYVNYAYLQLFICIEEFLKIKEIFEFGDKCYVKNTIKVAEKIGEDKWKSIIKLEDKNKPSFWLYEENEEVKNIGSDFRMSCVLIFLYGAENSNFKNWPTIRDVRNNKAAHPKKSEILDNEIFNILEFIEFIFNKDNMLAVINKNGLDDK